MRIPANKAATFRAKTVQDKYERIVKKPFLFNKTFFNFFSFLGLTNFGNGSFVNASFVCTVCFTEWNRIRIILNETNLLTIMNHENSPPPPAGLNLWHSASS